MAGKSNSWENGLQLLMFNNTNFANVGDATGLRGSSTAGSLYFSLHTADPGEAGAQNTNEVAYTNYARIAIPRASVTGFTVSTNQVSNAVAVTFAACGVTGATALYWGVGTASSGAGVLLYSGTLSSLAVGMALGESTDDTMTIKNHALAVDDRIAFFAMGGLALPTGITEGTVYFVKTVPTVDTITLATTSGGAVVDITVDGQGMAFKVLPFSITTGVTPSFAIGAWQLLED